MRDDTRQIAGAIIDALPLAEKVGIARMDGGGVATLSQKLRRHIVESFDCDPDDVPAVAAEIWQQLRRSHRLRIVK